MVSKSIVLEKKLKIKQNFCKHEQKSWGYGTLYNKDGY